MNQHRLPFVTLSAAILVTGQALAQDCHDLDGVTAAAQALLQQSPLFGSSCVSIEQGGVLIYEQGFGSLGPTDVLPIASATKTLSAAVLMSLVDDGLLKLDDPVGQYLPEWDYGAHAQITLRMCFAHTSGLPDNHPAVTDNALTLREAAAQLSSVPLDSTPGTEFVYGNVSMHVAGAVCEVVGGKPWEELFQERIAQPLGMTSTDYGDPAAYGANPLIAGGARSNARDFAAFMAMLRNAGFVGDFGASEAVLSMWSVGEMCDEQTANAAMVRNVHPDEVPYGLGIWIEEQASNGITRRATAAGAFGFTGWIDWKKDSSGVFAVQYLWPLVYPFTEQLEVATDDALLPFGVTCLGTGSPACADGTWLTANTAAFGSNSDFALRVSQAPPFAPGWVALGDPFPSGLPIADLTAFVGPSFLFVATAVTDGDGRAIVPAPLVQSLASGGGTTFALQTLWLGDDPCTALGLQASHAITVKVGF
ncbi:MAG: serine hydrolase [Planctomycetota bacterium]